MKKKQLLWGIAVILATVMVLGSCIDAEPEYGELTINNLPTVPEGEVNYHQNKKYWEVMVFKNTTITGQEQLKKWIVGENPNNCVAYSSTYSGLSPFPFKDYNGHGEGFLNSGTYLVFIDAISDEWDYCAVISGVVFKNGKATIDYDNMSKWYDLPRE